MHIIEEMVEYFSELLTEEQKFKVEQLLSVHPPTETDSKVFIHPDFYNILFDLLDPTAEYEQYDLPPPDRREGHARGKRRKLRRPAVSAAGLVANFRKTARKRWEETPVSLELFLALAGIRPPGGKKAGRWRDFLASVDSLKGLDADALADRVALLLQEERRKTGDDGGLFAQWFEARLDGSFTKLADDFCRSRVEGEAGRAVLKALRSITCPETAEAPGDIHIYRPFLENRELVGIFDYYRILRKLEYLLDSAADEAVRRIMRANGEN